MEKVSVLTGAGFAGREAGLAAAKRLFFPQVGLDVTMVAGRGTNENLKLLRSGAATFATLDVSGAIMAKAKGGADDFWLTCLLHRRNLACFMALSGSGINAPADLAGKKVSFVPGGINHLLFGAYAGLAGFPPGGVQWVQAGPVQADHAKLLAGRKVDAISQFVPAQVAVEQITGRPVTVLPFTKVMGDIHGSAIAVTQQTAASKPDLVRRFNEALLRGLRYALDHPETAAQMFLELPQARTQQKLAVEGEIKSLAGYVHLTTAEPSPAPFGHFDRTRLMQNIAILQGAGQIPAGFTPDQLVKFDLAGNPIT
ncbi:ABC transporter substrate-binding protein [Phytohabitans flavus]|uniref:ABC transporter substrate-binding protein n=1 Tax=Phytohabitans flavus TaxID=1076124 RepID=UPI0015675284|nr:ABC transporter substrate-binding protein [Phytohabitans flavus]